MEIESVNDAFKIESVNDASFKSLESSGWRVFLSLLIAHVTLWDPIRVISVGL